MNCIILLNGHQKRVLVFTVENDLLGDQGMKQSELIHGMQVSSRKFSHRTQMPSVSLKGLMAHIGTHKLVNRKSKPNHSL